MNHSWASGTTLSGRDFYGSWSTASSVLSPKRQIIEITEENGKWINIYDDGTQKTLPLKKEDITIEGDILKIDYKYPDGNYKLKLILGGWNVRGQKHIFGTVYMYANQGDGLQLFNGIQMNFESGISQIPPQAFWSFFQNAEKKTQNVEAKYFQKLEVELSEIEDINITEDNNEKIYQLKRIGYTIFVTQKGSPAYPSAIGIRQSPIYSGEMQVQGKYAGQEIEFVKLYDNYLAMIEEEKAKVIKNLQKIVDHAENPKVSK